MNTAVTCKITSALTMARTAGRGGPDDTVAGEAVAMSLVIIG
jgi:hypothetical protein